MEKNNYSIHHVSGKNLAEAYHNALVELDKYGQIYPCDAYSNEHKRVVQKEINLALTIEDVNMEPYFSRLSINSYDPIQDYELEFLYGIRDFNVLAYKLGLDKNLWPYTYSERIKKNDQIDFVVEQLIMDKYTRRAVILIRDNETDMKVDDPACLQEFVVQIRDNNLNMTGIMRSNDATRASDMNMWAFIRLQKRLVELVKERALEYIDILEEKLINEKDSTERKKYEETIKYLESFKELKAKTYNHEAISFHAYGEVLTEEQYRNRIAGTNTTLEEEIEKGFAVPYENGYIWGEIRDLKKKATKIKNSKLEDTAFYYEGDSGYKNLMQKRICPYLADTVIAKTLEYGHGLFNEALVRDIETILIEYNIDFEDLVNSCSNSMVRKIDLIKEYEKLGMEVPGTKVKVKK